MNAPSPEPKTRQHEHTLEIAASPQDVWRAITNAQELVNWFVFDSDVDPREGGHITYGWGDELRTACRIHVWQPESHLRTGWLTHLNPQDGAEHVMVDWFLEGDAGRTKLRLVHSGFGANQAWDNEFDGTNRGWNFELRSLKHYLENHRGKPRAAFVARHAVPQLDAAGVWKRLIAPDGFLRLPGAAGLHPGDALNAPLASGDTVTGAILQNVPPTDFAFRADNFNRGLIRLASESCFGQHEAQVWVSLWGVPPAEVAAVKKRLEAALAKVFA